MKKQLLLLHGEMMKLKSILLIYLSMLAFVDMVIPIPFTTILLIYVLFEKPLWFKDLVYKVYDIKA